VWSKDELFFFWISLTMESGRNIEVTEVLLETAGGVEKGNVWKASGR
jgi:hypothetical protein